MPSPACLVGKIEVQDPLLLVVEAVAQWCSIKNVFLKIRKIHMKTPVPEPLFNAVANLTPATLL